MTTKQQHKTARHGLDLHAGVAPFHVIDGVVEAIDACRATIQEYLDARAAYVESNRDLYIANVGNPVDAEGVVRARIVGVIFNNLLDFSTEREELRAHLPGPAHASTDDIIKAESDLQDVLTPPPPPEPPPPEGATQQQRAILSTK
jgi:hypothetical protein